MRLSRRRADLAHDEQAKDASSHRAPPDLTLGSFPWDQRPLQSRTRQPTPLQEGGPERRNSQ